MAGEINVGAKSAVGADGDVLVDDSVGADDDGRVEPGLGMDDGRGMDRAGGGIEGFMIRTPNNVSPYPSQRASTT